MSLAKLIFEREEVLLGSQSCLKIALVATHFLPWKKAQTTHSIRFCSALSWLRRFLYTVSASVESSTSKGILKGEQIILVWMKLLKTIRTITMKRTKTLSTIDHLCSEESPSKRLASIQVVSSGYSTNLPNHPLQHQDTNIKMGELKQHHSSKWSIEWWLTTGQNPDAPLSSAGREASPCKNENIEIPTFLSVYLCPLCSTLHQARYWINIYISADCFVFPGSAWLVEGTSASHICK